MPKRCTKDEGCQGAGATDKSLESNNHPEKVPGSKLATNQVWGPGEWESGLEKTQHQPPKKDKPSTRLMKSQLASQCPMYLPTKTYYELVYQRPLLLLWIPKMLTLLGLMKVAIH